MLYRVADHTFGVDIQGECRSWEALEWHYRPFAVAEGDALFAVTVRCGALDPGAREGFALTHSDQPETPGFMSMDIYSSDSEYLFEVTQPRCKAPNMRLVIDREFTRARVTLDEGAGHPAMAAASLTSALQLAYMLATATRQTILTHASAVVCEGRAYLFLGKSGTGKSTHSRLWLENIPGTQLLNDDHPVLRVGADGGVTAYGAPWSGKTDCYINMSAPVGAIVRIHRAPHDAIERLGTVQAYASLITSFSGMTIDKSQADARHKAIERIVGAVPCYVMHCLPDDEAARVCAAQVLKTKD